MHLLVHTQRAWHGTMDILHYQLKRKGYNMKKNGYEKLCDELKKENRMDEMEKKVRKYVDNKYEVYLKLKAEANAVSFIEYFSTLLAITAMIVSGLDLAYNVVADEVKMYFGTFELLILVVWLIYFMLKVKEAENVGKVGKYIKVVLEEMEEEARTWKKK